MPALVIDASLAAAWCFADERTDYTNAVLRAISAPLDAIAPSLWGYEVRNAVLMGLRLKRIFKTSRSASASVNLPAPNTVPELVRFMR
jgi:hypothetical protein